MPYPPELPPDNRTDTTVAAGNHAEDHNLIVEALQAIIDVLGPDPGGEGTVAEATARRVGSASATVNLASIPAGSTAETTLTVTGAQPGDVVGVGVSTAPEAGLMLYGYVSAANTVKVRVANVTGSAVDPASRTYTVVVTR
jgi:hypothetical protein